MARLITGIPLPPAVPAVRGSGRNLPPPRPPRGPPPGPPPVIAGPPPVLRSGLSIPPPGPPRGPQPGSSRSSLSSSPPPESPILGSMRGRGKRGRILSLRPQRPPGSTITEPPGPGPIHTVDAGEIFSPLNSEILDTSLRSTIPPTVDTANVAEIVAAAGGINLHHVAPGPDDKISATKEITLGTISESKDEGSGGETDYETSHEGDSDISSEYLSEYGSVKDSEHGSDTDTEVKSKSPEKEEGEIESEVEEGEIESEVEEGEIEHDSEHGLSPAQTEALKNDKLKKK